jgi:hypothetical protein
MALVLSHMSGALLVGFTCMLKRKEILSSTSHTFLGLQFSAAAFLKKHILQFTSANPRVKLKAVEVVTCAG